MTCLKNTCQVRTGLTLGSCFLPSFPTECSGSGCGSCVFSSELWNCLQFFPLSNLLLNTTDTVMNWLWQDPTSWLKSNHQLMLGGYLFALYIWFSVNQKEGKKCCQCRDLGNLVHALVRAFLERIQDILSFNDFKCIFNDSRNFYNVYLDNFLLLKSFTLDDCCQSYICR